MIKYIQLLIIASFFLACNNNSAKNQGSGQLGLDTTANIYSVTSEDDEMNSAISKARQTLSDFDRALKSNNPAYTDFAVKKRYPTPDDGGEHIWIAGIVIENGSYKGFVNNDAEKTTEVKYGDTVIIRKDEITDWMYLDKNVLRGGYTIRAMRDKLSTEEKIKMDKELGFKIED